MLGEYSESFSPNSGVPQGSVLGPILFIIFINDITKLNLASKIEIFADDVKLYKMIDTLSDAAKLQEDINKISRWCKTWNLPLQMNKCNIMTYTLNKDKCITFEYKINEKLERITEIKDLGVIMNSKLNFNEHINRIITTAFRMLGFLKRESSFLKK